MGGSAPLETNEQRRRAELKRLSNERVKNWPNTLEALRKKKESFLKEREETEELRRQEQDREVLLLHSFAVTSELLFYTSFAASFRKQKFERISEWKLFEKQMICYMSRPIK